jgi:hypothetical protein
VPAVELYGMVNTERILKTVTGTIRNALNEGIVADSNIFLNVRLSEFGQEECKHSNK